MASDWEIASLVEHCKKIGSGATPRGGSSVYLEEGEITLIRSQNVYNDGFKRDGLVFITEEAAEKLKNVIVEENDILLNITGDSVARVCMVDKQVLPARVNQHVSIIRPKESSFNPLYLRYQLVSPHVQQLLLNYASAGATRHALTKSMIENLGIPKPDLDTQNNIAHILGSLDDKIELNSQMNETLEAMAQALFKSWFVDFDPVIDNALAAGNAIPDELLERAEQRKGIEKKDNSDIQILFPDEFEFTEEMGWIPKGWELISFGEFCDIKKGRNITKSTVSEGYIPVVAGGLKPAYYHNESNVNAPVITVSASGANAGFVNLYYQDIWASDCSYISENMSPFIFTTYSFLKYHQDKVFGLQQGAVQPHVYPKDLSRLNFVDSDESVKIVIEKNLNSYYEKIKFNEAQTEALAKIRDTLLPKLMSGELRIPDDIF